MTMFPSFPKKHKSVAKQTELPAQGTAATARRPSSKQQLTYAHGWLGVITSGLLCLIFWFGGLSVFRAEIQAWSEAPFLMAVSKPHTASVPIERQAFEGSLTLFRAIEAILPRYDYDPHEHISVILPQAAQPYYQFYIDLVAENHPDSSMAEIQVEPNTGKTLGAINRYPLANFFYRLHYSGNMGKIGLYLIGVCALLLGFALFSGIWIQIKKLWQQFFLYRRDTHATTYLDSHRVIGVISLPFTAIIALTGLIFNLVIVYQATFVSMLYVRLMPLNSGFSGEWVTVVFMVSLVCWLVASCWAQAMKSLIKYSLFLFSVLITLTLLLGLAQYAPDWLLSLGETSQATITIDVGLVLLAVVFGAVAVQKGLKTPEKVV